MIPPVSLRLQTEDSGQLAAKQRKRKIFAIKLLFFHFNRVAVDESSPGPEVIKHFSCSTQLSMKL